MEGEGVSMWRVKKKLVTGLLAMAVLFIFNGIAFGEENVSGIEGWESQSLKEMQKIEELMDRGYGDRLNLTAEDQDVKITIEGVIADDVHTVLLMEIVDMKGNTKYEPNGGRESVLAKGKFCYDEDDIDQRDKEMGQSSLGGSYIFYTPDKNRTKIVITLNPIASSEEVIDFTIKELSELRYNQDQTLQGNWHFQIPVKKHAGDTYRVNQEMDVDGIPVVIEEIVIAPTVTVLTYSYRNLPDTKDTTYYIHNLRIEANGMEYQEKTYGVQSFHSDGEGLRRQTFQFESMYFERPKEIKIKTDGYDVMVEKHETLELDLDKPFPQTFTYMDSPVTIESVELGDHQARIVMTDHLENRTYEGLNFEVEVKGISFTTRSYHHGCLMDDQGREVNEGGLTPGDQGKKMKYYITSYDILVENDASANTRILKEYQGTGEVIPYSIQITGYYETRFIEKDMVVTLMK